MSEISAAAILEVARSLQSVVDKTIALWTMTPEIARQIWHRQKPMRKKIARIARDKGIR